MNELAVEYGSVQSVIDKFSTRFGKRLSVSFAVRERFGKDESFHPSVPPDAVITPHTTDEVSDIVSTCAEHRVVCVNCYEAVKRKLDMFALAINFVVVPFSGPNYFFALACPAVYDHTTAGILTV